MVPNYDFCNFFLNPLSALCSSHYFFLGGGRKGDDLLEQILYDWYTQQISNNVKVTCMMLRAKAEELSASSATIR